MSSSQIAVMDGAFTRDVPSSIMSIYFFPEMLQSERKFYINVVQTYVKLGGGQGGTDPPPGDWCLGLVPPWDPQKFGKIMRLMHKKAIKLKNKAPPLSSDPI